MGIGGIVPAPPGTLAQLRERHAAQLHDAERELLLAALVYTENDRGDAARVLGISRQTLYTMAARLNVELPEQNGRGRTIAKLRRSRQRRRRLT